MKKVLLLSLSLSVPSLLLGDNMQRRPWIEAEVAPSRPYIQQQVTYTLRLYRNSHLQRGSFMKPAIPGALAVLSYEAPPVQVTRRGEEFELIEQRYLLFPQFSGTLRLPPPIFSSRDLFVQGASLTLEVRPRAKAPEIPHWLVTPRLSVVDTWSFPAPPLEPGAHIRRTLTIEALHVTGAQIPSLSPLPEPTVDIQVLSDQPSESFHGADLTGRRRIELLYIPRIPGTTTVKPITIGWWNSTSDQPTRTMLSGRKLVVTSAKAPPKAASSHIRPDPVRKVDEAAATENLAPSFQFSRLWLLSLFAMLFLFLPRLRKQLSRYLGLLPLLYGLMSACLRNAPRAARDTLLAWDRHFSKSSPPLDLLATAKTQQPESIVRALCDLDETLYSGRGARWRGSEALAPLLRLLLSGGPPKPDRGKRVLPPLWRDHQ